MPVTVLGATGAVPYPTIPQVGYGTGKQGFYSCLNRLNSPCTNSRSVCGGRPNK
jgi:hypothetical protein